MESIKQKIQDYISTKTQVTSPEIQFALSLSYAEVRAVIDEMIDNGTLEFVSGLNYKVIKKQKEKSVKAYEPGSYYDDRAIKALWACIKLGCASPTAVQRYLSCGYAAAARSIDWLEEHGFIGAYPERKINISAEEYLERFGNPEDSIEEMRKDTVKSNSELEKRFRAFLRNDDIIEDDDDIIEVKDDTDKVCDEQATPLIVKVEKGDRFGDWIKKSEHARKEECADNKTSRPEQAVEAAENDGEKQSFDKVNGEPEGVWTFDTEEAFENKCMDVIQSIVLLDEKQDRLGAIEVSKKWLQRVDSPDRIKVYERVVREFEISSDEEYILLRNQLFG